MDHALYRALGIEQSADIAEIKRAYRRLAKRMHPDVPGGDAEAFERIRHAHAVLSDPARRARYDETGEGDIATEQISPEMAATIQVISKGVETLLANAMKQGQSPEVLDLPRMLTKLVRDDIVTMTQMIRDLEKVRPRLAGIAERFTVIDDGPNIMRSAVLTQISNIDGAITGFTKQKADLERALTAIDRHKYRLDALLQTPDRGRSVSIKWMDFTSDFI